MLRFPSSIQRLGGFAQVSRCMCSDSGEGPPKRGKRASKGHSLDDLLSGKASKKAKIPEINPSPTDSGKILKSEFTEAEKLRAEKVRDKINAVLAKGGSPEMVKIAPQKSEESLEQKLKREKGKKAIKAINDILSTLNLEPNSNSQPPLAKAPLDLAKPSKPSTRTPDEEVMERRYHGVDVEIVSAIRGVEAEVGGGPRVQSALLDRLAMVSDTSSTQTENLNEMLSSMDVEERKSVPMHQFPNQSNAGPLDGGDINHMKMTYGLLNIFTQERMQNAPVPEKVHTPTWDKCVSLELQHSLNQNPTNQWQEFAQWTDQGKIWSFPIDNEIGLDEEKATGFQDHVFLERHLAGWCPRVGPIRHFMELVTSALSKNPHMTAARKKENIDWFRDFFEEKRTLLEDIGAFPKKQQRA